MNSFSVRLLATAAVIASPDFAFAQTAPDAPSSAEGQDIVVTAQRRAERLIEVPLSISAIEGDTLARAGVATPSDLARVVPGFTYQASRFGPPVYSIRGIGFYDNSNVSAPTVTVYGDQVPLPYLAMATGASLDLERVEVLKGPQGTLFGQNSTGGAINFIAAKPTKEFAGGASAELNNFGQINLDGFVSGPLSPSLGVRLAARTEQGGAWQKSISRPGDKLGSRNFTSARLTVDWEPSTNAHFVFTASGWQDKGDTSATQYLGYQATSPNYTSLRAELLATPRAPDDNRFADWDPGAALKADTDFYQLSMRGDFQLADEISLGSITAYSNLDAFQVVDSDGTQYNNTLNTIDTSIKSFFQELRLQGDHSNGSFRWMIGANYSHDKASEYYSLVYTGSNSGVGPRRYNNLAFPNSIKAESKAVFGSVDFDITSQFSGQVSARYTKRTVDGSNCLQDTGVGDLAAAFNLLSTRPLLPGECVTLISPLPAGPPPFVPSGLLFRTLDENNVAWRANLSWKPTDDVHVYGNVTRGFKGGSFSLIPLVFDSQFTPIPQEKVTAYELGFRTMLADRKVELSGAVFYYDYADKQILGSARTPFGNGPALVSVPKSRVTGFELNVSVRPIGGLSLTAGLTHIDTKVTSSFSTRDPLGNLIDIQGLAFPATAKWQASADVQYEFPISSSLTAFAGGGAAYRSRTSATFGGGPLFELAPYATVDLRAGIGDVDDRWRAEVFGRNIFNEGYGVNVARIIDTIARYPGRPATYGIRLSTRF
jgi:iron complex outermembrane recepter protein